jgi:hypothetical protein
MKRRHHTPAQISRKPSEAERMLAKGRTILEALKELGISEHTYHRWRNQYGGMKADDAKRLKELGLVLAERPPSRAALARRLRSAPWEARRGNPRPRFR